MEPLADAGFRAIVIELPGHSLSDKPLDSSAYTLARMTDVVAEVATSLGIERCAVIGHSMGTAIALELARRAPATVTRLVLVSPLGLDRIRVTTVSQLVTPHLVRRLLPGAVPRAAVKTVLRAVYGRRGAPSERDVDHYWAPTAFPEFGYAMIALLREFDWRESPEARLRATTAPTLLVCGTRDPFVRHTVVTRRAALINDARTLVLKDVGHVPLAEAPEDVVPPIIAFLAPMARP
jgi:4,5:9,10-diseco-3-hydroxy-5,9,17-trioxoandrosta-1(10),2-diene-4-oate hydrolase